MPQYHKIGVKYSDVTYQMAILKSDEKKRSSCIHFRHFSRSIHV